MSDWSSPQHATLRTVIIVAATLACAVALFFAGRWSAPTSAPAASPAESRQMTPGQRELIPSGVPGAIEPRNGSMLKTTEQGVPYEYTQDAAGARAAAVNAVIGGLWLRPGPGDLNKTMLATGSSRTSPETELLLNLGAPQSCGGMDSATASPCPPDRSSRDGARSRVAYDFAPPMKDTGVRASAGIPDGPAVDLSADKQTAVVSLRWVEHRSRIDGNPAPSLGTAFTIRLVWQDDWKVAPDGVSASPASTDEAGTRWLWNVIGFIGEET